MCVVVLGFTGGERAGWHYSVCESGRFYLRPGRRGFRTAAAPLPPMQESAMTQDLDERGLLDAARGAGVYALELRVPEDLRRRWRRHFDAEPADLDRLATAERVLYAGAASDVYGRLCEHVAADVRRASVLRVCPPVEVVAVEPTSDPFEAEFSYANSLADADTAVYYNGVII